MKTDVGARERPILFSAPMVRAILAGRKTQTRRVVKPQPVDGGRVLDLPSGFFVERAYRTDPLRCPYGAPGDRLWVREAFLVEPEHDGAGEASGSRIVYRADWEEGEAAKARWRPSIFMPRDASRILLEVKSVRVERLQEITPDDVFEEGRGCWDDGARLGQESVDDFGACWDELNGKRGFGWDANPWVWVVEFSRLEPAS